MNIHSLIIVDQVSMFANGSYIGSIGYYKYPVTIDLDMSFTSITANQITAYFTCLANIYQSYGML